ncbi:MAG: enoyl-CoA hydratase/isomerase family protein [Planctomycetota bacterium]|nr:enoyl-CoA hydratase/isomerase family protein [Planctomycetota bacterium]
MYEIRMQHPAKNSLGNDLMGWLEFELERAGKEPLLITGTADSFSAGLNLKEVASMDERSMEVFLRRLDALAARLYQHPAPTVACVSGHAIAGGCVLMMCCDWRVARRDPKIKIGVNEVSIGACFPPAIFGIVRARLAPHVRERVMLGAGLSNVDEALALGLIDEIADDAEDAAKMRIEILSSYPRAAYALTKSVLRQGISDVTPAALERFRKKEVPLWASAEMKERVAVVLGKR